MRALAAFGTLILLALPAAAQHDHKEHGDHGQHADGKKDGHEYKHHSAHHRFDDAERWSKMFDAEERKAWQKPAEVVRLMEIQPGMTVADLGAGTGYFLGHLSTAVGPEGRVLGLDVEPNMVDFMNERATREGWSNVTAQQCPYDAPGLAAGSTDRILIVNTWHHIQDRGAYSAKLKAALKEGGQVVVVDLTKESPHGPPPSERLLPEEVIAELEAGGLAAEAIDETLPDQYIVVGRLR